MDDKQEEVKRHYARSLKAVDYMEVLEYFWKNLPELFRQLILFLDDVFRSGRFQGSKVLEIGSGVTVHSIASASRYFENIVMSDYVENNLEELRKWLKGQSSIKQLLDLQAGLEGYGNDLSTGRSIIEARIRKTVKRVTQCDFFKEGILLEKDTNPDTSPPFDVLISCYTLEVVCVDFKQFAAALKRTNTLLRPGGGFILIGFSRGKPWEAGDYTFPHLTTDENELHQAFADAGFGKIEIKIMLQKGKTDDDFKYKKFDKMFCAIAEKI